MFPKMVALSVGVSDVRAAHPQHLLEDSRILQRRCAQFSPIASFAASDHVVNRRESKPLMREMTMVHKR